jgi:hypothetical protein
MRKIMTRVGARAMELERHRRWELHTQRRAALIGLTREMKLGRLARDKTWHMRGSAACGGVNEREHAHLASFTEPLSRSRESEIRGIEHSKAKQQTQSPTNHHLRHCASCRSTCHDST